MDPAQIENALREADLPATKANVAKVASAVQMTTILPELSQDARAYILEDQMVPTIENLYQGQYSASGALDSSIVDDEVWQQLQGQIAELLQAGGLPADETTLEQAKWLFADPGPGRLCTRALGILPDGTLKRIKIVQDRYGLTSYYEDKPLGSLWNKWNPLVTWTVINR